MERIKTKSPSYNKTDVLKLKYFWTHKERMSLFL